VSKIKDMIKIPFKREGFAKEMKPKISGANLSLEYDNIEENRKTADNRLVAGKRNYNETDMTLRERQDGFIGDMLMLDNWTDRFNYLISESESLPAECPEHLLKFRIDGCQSKTCFRSFMEGNVVFSDGWSNSAVMGGIISGIMKIFNRIPARDLQDTEIDFHTKSGLTDNLTPMRRAALEEIIRRIILLPGNYVSL
jgi:sulfur transfer protein SufE